MSQPAPETVQFDPAAQLEAEIKEAIALCGGDVVAALRATLIANTYLQGEVDRLEASASCGFARRRRQRTSNVAERTEKKVG
jgi:hypothetical protein